MPAATIRARTGLLGRVGFTCLALHFNACFVRHRCGPRGHRAIGLRGLSRGERCTADFLGFFDCRLRIAGDRCDVDTDLTTGCVLTTVRTARHLQARATVRKSAGSRKMCAFVRAHLVVARGQFLQASLLSRINWCRRLLTGFMRRFPRSRRRPVRRRSMA